MDWISNGWKFCCWILYGNILYKFSFAKCKKGTREIMRTKEYRLAKRLVPSSYADITAMQYEYLAQWRYVYEEQTKISKWWQIWKEEYSVGIAYGEWVDIPAIDIGKAQEK